MTNSPKILVLTPRFPYPVIGGDRLRIYEICKELSKTFRLTLLSLCETKDEISLKLPDDGVFSEVHRVFLPRWRSALNCIAALPSNRPLQIAYYSSSEFSQRVKQLARSNDAVFAHLIRTGDYIIPLSNRPRILEMTDAISLNYERVKSTNDTKGLKALIYKFEARRLNRYERNIIGRFDLTTLVSATDVDFLCGSSKPPNVIVCSNGVSLTKLPFQYRANSAPVIAYIGNMSSVQNLDACIHFARDILPTLRHKIDCRFRVVGKISEIASSTLRAFPGVEVTGTVADIAAAVADARVGVCPVRIGAGVQNKVLEYMALGLPTITSSVGLEGFAAEPGKHLLVADSVDDYCRHLTALWTSEAMRADFSRAGREYVQVHHEWSALLRPMIERIDTLVRPGQI